MTPVQMYEHVGCSVLGLHRREKFEMDSITQKVLTVDATAYSNAHFGQDTSIIIALDDVACTTAQSRLIDCTYDSNTADCSHTDDAGVQCAPREFYTFEVKYFCIAISESV